MIYSTVDGTGDISSGKKKTLQYAWPSSQLMFTVLSLGTRFHFKCLTCVIYYYYYI